MNILFGILWRKSLYVSAKSIGLGICPCCKKINNMWSNTEQCERCGATFSIRKPYTLQYTMAWTIAALIMFIPANMLPMMVVYTMGSSAHSTIIEGVILFMQMGMYPIAVVIFIASFVIPVGKIVCLFILVFQAKSAKPKNLKLMTKLYSIVEFLGPWSMLDVFVVAIMAAVVNLGFISSIAAAGGITFFGLTVIFTMFASASFDIRLLWDKTENNFE